VAGPNRPGRASLITYPAVVLLATVLALISAVLHVSWNLIVKAGRDRLLAQWGVTLAGALVSVPVLVLRGLPEAGTLPFVATSAVVHVAYSLSLVAAYEKGDLSAAYPIARGVAPLMTAAGAAIWLDDSLPALGYVGIVLVTTGLVAVAYQGAVGSSVGWALVTGLTISVYTLVDAAGVRLGDESVRYVITLFALHSLLLTIVVLVRRGLTRMVAGIRASASAYAAGGVGGVAAYGLVLAAVRFAPLGYVAALRESSVILGAIAGWYLLKEPFGVHRTAGAVVVALGIGLMLVP
jgi:drug/metabolite transporter (DMT)-like permease